MAALDGERPFFGLDIQNWLDRTETSAKVMPSLFKKSIANMKAFNSSFTKGGCPSAVAVLIVFLAFLPCVQATSWVATAQGVVGLWHGDGNGDDAVGGNNAALFNGVKFADGVIGLGFKCDGMDEKIVVSNTPVLNFAARQDFSIEAWIKPSAAPGNFQGLMTVISKRVAPDTITALGYELYLRDGALGVQLADKLEPFGWHNFESAGPDLRDGRFHHVAVTVERLSPVGGKLYVDGKVVLTFDPTTCPGDLSNAGPLRIGNHPQDGLPAFFNGIIDEVSIYNRALSPAEMLAVASAGAGAKTVLSLLSATSPVRPQIGSMTRQAGGNMRMEFTGAAGTTYAVEASTNLVHWEKIGDASQQPDGTFQFEDADSGKFSARFYRIASQK